MPPKTEKQILGESDQNGFRYAACPPEDGHPLPLLGWRLMVATDQNIFGWVCIQIGAEAVMKALADKMNKEDVVQFIHIPSLKDFEKEIRHD